jgi:hypothetical protein
MLSILHWRLRDVDTMNRLKIVEELAHELMKQHGIDDWRFTFDRAKTRCGCTDYSNKIISMSKYYVNDPSISQENIVNTILHEIAHVLAGYEAGHTEIWRAVAKNIGCDGHTSNAEWHGVPYKYRVTSLCGLVNTGRHLIQCRLLQKRCAASNT